MEGVGWSVEGSHDGDVNELSMWPFESKLNGETTNGVADDPKIAESSTKIAQK